LELFSPQIQVSFMLRFLLICFLYARVPLKTVFFNALVLCKTSFTIFAKEWKKFTAFNETRIFIYLLIFSNVVYADSVIDAFDLIVL
jgi:hypothetical protein